MRSFDELPAAQAIVSYQRRLERKGVRALQITDLDLVVDALAQMGALTNDIEAGGPYVTRWLDPRKNVLSSRTSFWIFLFDSNGRIVGKASEGYEKKSDCEANMTRGRVASDSWEFYKDRAGDWRWRRTARNGQIVGCASEGYKARADAEANAARHGFAG